MQANHEVEISRLRDGCENMKICLSTLDVYTMELSYFLGMPQYSLTLTRKQLEKICNPILLRIQSAVQKTVQEYGAAIDRFLLVGNATKMPAVGKAIAKAINAEQLSGIDPGTIVAAGAALQGAILSGDIREALLLDLVPYSLGIAVLKKDSKTSEEEISRLIVRNSRIPIKCLQEYTTVKDNQTQVQIKIYQGESSTPDKNYYLGNFSLDGILPARAGIPKIEVTFDISTDCVLTVSAKDKAIKRQQSIRIEDTLTLSPIEKDRLQKYFAENENHRIIEKEVVSTTVEIDKLLDTLEKIFKEVAREIDNLSGQFHEKVEVNARFYKVNAEQVISIQDMFSRKDQLPYTLQKCKDEVATIKRNLRQTLAKPVDVGNNIILGDRLSALTRLKKSLLDILGSTKQNLLHVLVDWNRSLREIEPDLDNMSPERTAQFYLVAGNYMKAKAILESMAASSDGLSSEAFRLLLNCYIRLCLRDEYRNTHMKYGNMFEMIYPDFSRLDVFLRSVGDSVFLIRVNTQEGVSSGSGFSIAPHLIATSRHVVEGAIAQNIKIIGKGRFFAVTDIKVDSVNDLAILHVAESLIPFRIGESNFVAPGESVLAIGFPSPSSDIHSENIFISKGIVNSIRKMDFSPDRVIFIDAKIGRGMSGGPLINDLGEAVGIITLIRYELQRSDMGTFAAENQPIALPIHIIKDYLSTF